MEVTYCEGVRIAVHVSGDVARSRDCVLGVRPEELKVTNTDDAAIKGVIDVVEPTGPDTMVTVRVGGHSVVARAEPRFQGRRGDQVAFKVDPLSINLFDAETENRINTAE
ncbi:TOBE domain-containing protein [Ferranicluibacter rubi]|uniref:TOBE domain-containing protein n=1 Tax=Ferranicluibacter rubi TaxID=2715133 RepID=UPI00248BC5CE|nr:TOBE domain-containing protein [Ferranicluibacter rubi]